MIEIYGASDDCIEVSGCEGADEFYADGKGGWQGDLEAPGEGERMRVWCWYDKDGCWQVGVGQVTEDVPLAPWPVTIAQHKSGYSALLSVDGPKGTRLVNVKPETS